MPGLLSRLFTRSSVEPTPSATTVAATLYDGDETLEVVGESHYQDALWAIVGGRRLDRVRYETYALLIPDPENPYDANAIEVLIDGQLVGFLSRVDAVSYRPGLLKLISESPTPLIALHAVVVGGGQRADGLGHLGVFLDHDPADFGLSRHHVSHGHLRTGVSEAMETELADGTHPLSWFGRLAKDDRAAIDELSTLLKDTSDPFERHYMFCESEHRLYRCRNKVASALDEFDVVCEQRHSEIGSIRRALVERFGAVPVIELYRQASIRWAKVNHWAASQEWAQRGINVYGDQAARPEVVEDLRKRLAHAIAKMDAADQPKPRKPSGATVQTPVGADVFDTLICAGCGQTFARKRTRGRKPRLCPRCRESSVRAVEA